MRAKKPDFLKNGILRLFCGFLPRFWGGKSQSIARGGQQVSCRRGDLDFTLQEGVTVPFPPMPTYASHSPPTYVLLSWKESRGLFRPPTRRYKFTLWEVPRTWLRLPQPLPSSGHNLTHSFLKTNFKAYIHALIMCIGREPESSQGQQSPRNEKPSFAPKMCARHISVSCPNLRPPMGQTAVSMNPQE